MELELEDLTGDLRLIADELGLEIARALFETFGGCFLYIPSKPPQRALSRHVKAQAAQGISCKRIAQGLGLSERYIQRILAK